MSSVIANAVRRMLDHRGWVLDPTTASEELAERFAGLVLDNGQYCGCIGCSSHNTLVLITEYPRIGAVHLRRVHDVLCDLRDRFVHVQLISRYTITSQTLHAARTVMQASGLDLSVIPWYIVLMQPLDHELVPAHRRATAEERRNLPHPLSLLPVLRSDDVVAQYLGLRTGDVVRIDRHDGTVYWRYVLAPVHVTTTH